MRATLKYMQLVDCKSGHSLLLTAIHKFKYNIIKRSVIPYDIVDLKNEHFKKADRSKSLIADLIEFRATTLPKKTNAQECSDHRTISLIAHASKIILKVLTQRIEVKVEAINSIKEDQYGFRKGRGTRASIGLLRLLGEKRKT